MNGARVIDKRPFCNAAQYGRIHIGTQSKASNGDRGSYEKGSATVEAAIVLPVFLIVLLTIAYIIRIFYAYNTVQASLSEVARKIGNMSYFYYVSGLKDYSDSLKTSAEEAGKELEEQKNTLISAFASFNDTVTGMNGSTSGNFSLADIENLVGLGQGLNQNAKDAYNIVQNIIKDPKAELKLVMTILAQQLSYKATNYIMSLIAQGDLTQELSKRVKVEGIDAAKALGIVDGNKGLDFSETSVFGDGESLEFVVRYSIKPLVPLGLIPEIKLSNKVKIIAWTGGRGESVKVKEAGNEAENTSGSSVWVEMDTEKLYWDRGLEIEDLQVSKIAEAAQGRGSNAVIMPKNYPAIDMYSFNSATGVMEYYDVFTLNPFLNTYTATPSKITYEIKRHGLRLAEADAPPNTGSLHVKTLKQTVVVIIPENSTADGTYFERAKTELAKIGVDVVIIKDYGSYNEEPTLELKEAS